MNIIINNDDGTKYREFDVSNNDFYLYVEESSKSKIYHNTNDEIVIKIIENYFKTKLEYFRKHENDIEEKKFFLMIDLIKKMIFKFSNDFYFIRNISSLPIPEFKKYIANSRKGE
jgi:hypothetical protein